MAFVEAAGDSHALASPARKACPANLPEHALAPYLPPLRVGDPLGLGGERPPPPPDPDPHDPAREAAEFGRSLLDDDARAELDAALAGEGYWPIDVVRAVVGQNSTKRGAGLGSLDPELLILIDTRTNYKIFVAGDNVFTRGELYESYPFHEFQVQPEAIFARQDVGVFPPAPHALAGELEYAARDADDETTEFIVIADLVGRAARANYVQRRAPLRVAKTKIYVGKSRWEDFAHLHRVCRGVARIAAAQRAYGGEAPAPLLALLGGGAGPRLLADSSGDVPGRREELAALRAADHARREAELREREARAAEREEATRARMDADIRRLEALYGLLGGAAGAGARGSRPAPPGSEEPEPLTAGGAGDSVPL